MEEEKDDEISIDFGKIKNFFKRKKEGEKEVDVKLKETKPEVPTNIENKTPEIKQELNKIAEQEPATKVEPQSEISEKTKQEKDDDEITIDLSWVKNIFRLKLGKKYIQ